MGRPRASGLVSEDVLFRAWRQHVERGTTLTALSEHHWQEWGYKNAGSLRWSLGRAFRVRGWTVRTHKEAIRLGYASPGGRPETTGISKGRAPTRAVKLTPAGQEWQRRRLADETHLRATLAASPELADLVAEQAADDHRYRYAVTHLSLDALSDDDRPLLDLLAYGHRYLRAHVTDEWTDALAQQIDRRREIDAWAEAA